MIVLAALAFVGCGAPPGPTVERTSSLEEAIAYYIDGDLQQAEARLNELIKQPLSREDLKTAYLYLGRIYLATGDYDKATEVLSAGRALGGDVRFEEYFEMASRHLGASRRGITRTGYVTRAQLATLIDERFGAALARDTLTLVMPGQMEVDGHWAESDIALVYSAGVMTTLPDGSFHPDEKVTRPAFYVTLCRLIESLGMSREVVEELFPLGYRGAFFPSDGGPGLGHAVISGGEVSDALDLVAREAGL